MYNVDFLPQLEKFRRSLRRAEEVPEGERLDYTHLRYSPPPGVRILECVEDTNGEWVPRKS